MTLNPAIFLLPFGRTYWMLGILNAGFPSQLSCSAIS